MANVIKHKRGSGSDPVASDLVVGEVAIRTDVGKLFTKMDNGSVAEIAGGGSDIAINTLSSSSGTGGGSATFNGSAFRFTLSAPPSVSAQQLLVSINGVIQKPVAGTGQPSEGFSVDGTDIILGDAPATGSDFFILTFKSLGVSEPADNSVTSAKIVDGTIVNADINASAAIAGTKISPDFGSQDVVTNGNITSGGILKTTGNVLTVEGATPRLNLIDTNNNSDFEIGNTNGTLNIADSTNGVNRLRVSSNGTVIVTGNLDAEGGLDVTGAITGTGDLTIDTNTLYVDSSNNRVGIGTTNPTSLLTLNHATSPFIRLNDSDTTKAGIGADGGLSFVFAQDNNPLVFTTSTGTAFTERMRIDSSGRLLINTSAQSTGTNSANAILTVNSQVGNATSAAILALRRGQASASISQNNTLGRIVFCDSQAGEYAFIEGEADLGSNGVGDTAGRIAFSTSADGSSAPTERMRIDSNGAVHIKSAGTSYLGFTGSGDAGIIVGNGSVSDAGLQIRTSSSGTCRVNFGDGDGSSSERSRGFIHYTHSDDSMQIGANSSERMRIDSSGRVGIGTTSPQEILHVKAASEAINTRDGVIFGSTDLLAADKGLPLVWTANIGTDADYGIASICGRKENATSDNGAGYLQFGTGNGPGAISERMRIDSLGNVGIGTTTPTGSNAGYNGALLHLHQTNSSLAGSQVHLTTGVSGQGIADGSIIAQWSDNNLYINNQENAAIRFFTNNGDRARIDADGLKLDGNTAAANALNDYEEGTFSATASAAGYSGGSAIAMADESYTKIGNMVYFNMRLQVASSLSDGDLTITGLPFTASQDSVVNFSWQDAASFNGGQGKISGTQCVRFNGTFPTHHTGTANIIFEGTYRTNS